MTHTCQPTDATRMRDERASLNAVRRELSRLLARRPAAIVAHHTHTPGNRLVQHLEQALQVFVVHHEAGRASVLAMQGGCAPVDISAILALGGEPRFQAHEDGGLRVGAAQTDADVEAGVAGVVTAALTEQSGDAGPAGLGPSALVQVSTLVARRQPFERIKRTILAVHAAQAHVYGGTLAVEPEESFACEIEDARGFNGSASLTLSPDRLDHCIGVTAFVAPVQGELQACIEVFDDEAPAMTLSRNPDGSMRLELHAQAVVRVHDGSGTHLATHRC